jgi:glycine betaine catabolism B
VPPGLVSNWLHDNLKVGDLVKLSGPTGKFTCLPNPAAKLLLISAGSGITPMMSMARWLTDTAADPDIVFFHGSRTHRDIIFRQELEMLTARLPNFRLAVSITQSELGQPWLGLTGRLTEAMLHCIAPDFSERTVYVCGPNGFMQNVKTLLETLQFPMQNYHEESFGAAKKIKTEKKQSVPSIPSIPSTPPTPAAPATPANSPALSTQPLVHFAQSNKELASDGTESILELAEQVEVKIRSSCKQGVCGVCKKRKLEGNVRYESEPDALDENEQAAGYILPCVAMPLDRVVIEA